MAKLVDLSSKNKVGRKPQKAVQPVPTSPTSPTKSWKSWTKVGSNPTYES